MHDGRASPVRDVNQKDYISPTCSLSLITISQLAFNVKGSAVEKKTGSLCCDLIFITSITWNIKIDAHLKYVHGAMISFFFFFFFFNSTSPVRPSMTFSSGGVINHGIGKGWSSRLAVIESRSHTALRCGLAATLWPPSRGGPYRRDYRSTIRSQEGSNTVTFKLRERPDKLLIPFRFCLAISRVANRIYTLQNLNHEEKLFSTDVDSVQEGRKGAGLENYIVLKLIEVPNESFAQSFKLMFYYFCEPFHPWWFFLCDDWLNWLNQHWGRISR